MPKDLAARIVKTHDGQLGWGIQTHGLMQRSSQPSPEERTGDEKKKHRNQVSLSHLRSPSPDTKTTEAGGKRFYFGCFSHPKQQLTPPASQGRNSKTLRHMEKCAVSSSSHPDGCRRKFSETPGLEYKPLPVGRRYRSQRHQAVASLCGQGAHQGSPKPPQME